MKNKLILLLMLAVTLATLPGCKKREGCTDPNSETYDPDAEKNDGSCGPHRYLDGVTINSFPSSKPDGTPWDSIPYTACDSNYCAPDLKLVFSQPSGGSVLSFSVFENASGSGYYVPVYGSEPVGLTRGLWHFSLWDWDYWMGPVEPVMGEGTVDPVGAGGNGTIEVNGTNGVSITIHYHN